MSKRLQLILPGVICATLALPASAQNTPRPAQQATQAGANLDQMVPMAPDSKAMTVADQVSALNGAAFGMRGVMQQNLQNFVAYGEAARQYRDWSQKNWQQTTDARNASQDRSGLGARSLGSSELRNLDVAAGQAYFLNSLYAAPMFTWR